MDDAEFRKQINELKFSTKHFTKGANLLDEVFIEGVNKGIEICTRYLKEKYDLRDDNGKRGGRSDRSQ